MQKLSILKTRYFHANFKINKSYEIEVFLLYFIAYLKFNLYFIKSLDKPIIKYSIIFYIYLNLI